MLDFSERADLVAERDMLTISSPRSERASWMRASAAGEVHSVILFLGFVRGLKYGKARDDEAVALWVGCGGRRGLLAEYRGKGLKGGREGGVGMSVDRGGEGAGIFSSAGPALQCCSEKCEGVLFIEKIACVLELSRELDVWKT